MRFLIGEIPFLKGGYFLERKFPEKIFASNCWPVYAKKPGRPRGRGFRGRVVGEYPRVWC